MSVTGVITLLTRQVTCREFSRCYDDVNICLWTDGSQLTQSAAQRACQQRNNSFLPRITNNSIQSKLAEFRSASGNLLGDGGFWIDVTVPGISGFHWIDGSQLAGRFVSLRVAYTAAYIREKIISSYMGSVDDSDHAHCL